MAVFDFDFPNDMFDDVLNIFDETAPKMIDEALPIYESAVKSELQPHRDTGELISSIKCKKAKKTENGAYIGYLTAEGASTKSTYTRENGKVEPFRNYQKALALEYEKQIEQEMLERQRREMEALEAAKKAQEEAD